MNCEHFAIYCASGQYVQVTEQVGQYFSDLYTTGKSAGKLFAPIPLIGPAVGIAVAVPAGLVGGTVKFLVKSVYA